MIAPNGDFYEVFVHPVEFDFTDNLDVDDFFA